MEIRKRNGQPEPYDSGKIRNAIRCAFDSVGQTPAMELMDGIMVLVENKVEAAMAQGRALSVEQIQDIAEQSLMEAGCYETLKSFILYRNERAKEREVRQRIQADFEEIPELQPVLAEIQKHFTDIPYRLEHLQMKFSAFYKQGMNEKEKINALIQAAVELTTQEAPDWEYIAARLLMLRFRRNLKNVEERYQLHTFYDKVRFLTEEHLYGAYILEHYSKDEIER